MRKSIQKKRFWEHWFFRLLTLLLALTGGMFLAEILMPVAVEQAPPPENIRVAPAEPKAPSAKTKAALRVSIIIDDIGQGTAPVKKLLELDIPLTFAVLPGRPHSMDTARMIGSAGHEVMLHLPMEPENRRRNNPGKTALMLSQSEYEIRSAVREMINATPNVAGMNNHMGSLFTKDGKKMRIVLDEAKKAGLFFVDSYTTPESVALKTARAMGVKSAGRKIFLDNDRDRKKIKAAISRVIKIAKRDGYAVAIGHPYPETISALAEMKAEMKASGVELVFASDVVR